jgi:hypothetical protein
MTVRVPDDISDVQPAWLTEALATDAKITSVVPERIGAGESFAGRVYRIRIDSEDERCGLPETAIVKLATDDEVMREVMGEGLFREARFYRDLSVNVHLPHPDVYYTDFDTESRAVAIIMQDMGDLRHDRTSEPSLDDCASLLRAIAHLHAGFWNAEVVKSGWLDPVPLPGIDAASTEYLRKSIEIERASGGQFAYLTKCMTLLCDHGLPPAEPRTSFTLCHGDFHCRNAVLRSEGESILYDWQGVQRGSGAADVAYFLPMSIAAGERHDHERELLEVYWRELCERGVEAYTIEEFLREYEEEVAVQLTRIYCAQAVVDFDSDPFAREYMLTNADAMAKDHRLLERLSSSRSS